ncbi:probable retinol dehydrogenase 13 [Cephalotrichum gorgonifer]|uniref:Probable retinol dehydrogenase 13 n=1 Tax=Cephalotrichum gorgonifer TaxID=2041049 RepID=A0AAE8MQQ4_9PEZI|nr:probable retinol dehydrogenase 13 [Cephalotrichum gorgonifer]
MPIPYLFYVFENGPPLWLRNNYSVIAQAVLGVAFLALLKIYTSGATCVSDRNMHGKVVMITGGTSGIGEQVTRQLAARGAQIVLLTQVGPSDPFLADFIEDVRTESDNHLVYAEQVDLSSLHSIRTFATKWIDNAPPRRLDMVILCAATLTPPGKPRVLTPEGVEETWMVNFLANFHLLGILSPALRAQPFDRDVRVIIATCSSYIGSPALREEMSESSWTPSKAYARSKLALMVFGQAYQKHLDAYERPDKMPVSAKVIFVDPGFSRTPGMRRWLTRGTLWGLVLYLVSYVPIWFLLKSPWRGAQSIVYAAVEASYGRGVGGKLIKECREVDYARQDVKDEAVAKKLWEESDKLIEVVEKEQAAKRAKEKKKAEERAKEEKEAEKAKEVEALVNAIKKGRENEKAKESEKAKARKRSKKANA